jgi:hypothetical protein
MLPLRLLQSVFRRAVFRAQYAERKYADERSNDKLGH